jgi:hypothetical protein
MSTLRQASIARRVKLLFLSTTAFALPVAAFAAGLPGAGTVTVGAVTSSTGSGGGGVGSTITNLTGAPILDVTGNSVVQWSGPANSSAVIGETTNAPGFNISGSSKLYVVGTDAGTSLLNVDASGNPSVIAGTLDASGDIGGNSVNVFVANTNGIVVTPTGTISAPVIGLIGANLASTTLAGGVIQANTAQINFAAGTNVPITYPTDGSVSILGTLNDNFGGLPIAADTVLVAGSGTVNVSGSVNATNLDVFGGVGGDLFNTGAFNPNEGTSTAGIAASYAYVPTDVTLANQSPQEVFADGDIDFSGFSALPSFGNYGWTGTLNNSGNLDVGPGIAGVVEGLFNPWFNTPNTGSSGFTFTPVGAVNNTGTINSTSGTFFANGFTNTGTLLVGNGNGLTVITGSGDITLGGTVAASASNAAISFADLEAGEFGVAPSNVTVTAPLTITGDSSLAVDEGFFGDEEQGATFFVNASGAVALNSAVSVTDTNAFGSRDASDSFFGDPAYAVDGSSITIAANQTVSNSNFSNTGQPEAILTVNKTGDAVTIDDGDTLTAGDVTIGGDNTSDLVTRPALTVNGNITATNTGYTSSGEDEFGGDVGSITAYVTSIGGDGKGTLTAQQFNFDYTRYINKSSNTSATNWITNGLALTSAGSDPTLNLNETGGGLQNTNITVTGDITVNANSTTAGFVPGAFLSGVLGTNLENTAIGNAGSHVVITSTGNIVLGGSSADNGTYGAQTGTPAVVDTSILGTAPGAYFWLPGLLYLANVNSSVPTGLSSTGSITAANSVSNDYLQPIAGFQGIYFGTDNLSVGGQLFTNDNSLVNFTTAAQVTQYKGVVYNVQASPSNISNTLNVAPNSAATRVYDFFYGS